MNAAPLPRPLAARPARPVGARSAPPGLDRRAWPEHLAFLRGSRSTGPTARCASAAVGRCRARCTGAPARCCRCSTTLPRAASRVHPRPARGDRIIGLATGLSRRGRVPAARSADGRGSARLASRSPSPSRVAIAALRGSIRSGRSRRTSILGRGRARHRHVPRTCRRCSLPMSRAGRRTSNKRRQPTARPPHIGPPTRRRPPDARQAGEGWRRPTGREQARHLIAVGRQGRRRGYSRRHPRARGRYRAIAQFRYRQKQGCPAGWRSPACRGSAITARAALPRAGRVAGSAQALLLASSTAAGEPGACSGATGAIASLVLAGAGLKVVCLEQGGWVEPQDHPHYSGDWQWQRRTRWSADVNVRRHPDDFPVKSDSSQVLMWNGVGGSTNVYGAIWPRFRPSSSGRSACPRSPSTARFTSTP